MIMMIMMIMIILRRCRIDERDDLRVIMGICSQMSSESSIICPYNVGMEHGHNRVRV